MEQTAVEWLVKKYFEDYKVLISELEFQQAKEMEKQQIIFAYDKGNRYMFEQSGEKYYNEEFNK